MTLMTFNETQIFSDVRQNGDEHSGAAAAARQEGRQGSSIFLSKIFFLKYFSFQIRELEVENMTLRSGAGYFYHNVRGKRHFVQKKAEIWQIRLFQ